MAVKPDLDGVPETALWTLWLRAAEARRPDRVLDDPMAIDVVRRLDYPFDDRFGKLFPAQSLIQALRVLTFDRQLEVFLHDHPDGTVVALGEGLETEFWRVDNGTVRWLTVDLPRSVEVRTSVLPHGPRQRVFAGSALDPDWLEQADPANGVMVTAKNLLMYLPPDRVHALISMCAKAFPGGTLLFDCLPPWMARFIERGGRGYVPPPLPWTFKPSELPSLRRIDPRIADVREVTPVKGRGLLGRLAPHARHLPLLAPLRPMIVQLTFTHR